MTFDSLLDKLNELAFEKVPSILLFIIIVLAALLIIISILIAIKFLIRKFFRKFKKKKRSEISLFSILAGLTLLYMIYFCIEVLKDLNSAPLWVNIFVILGIVFSIIGCLFIIIFDISWDKRKMKGVKVCPMKRKRTPMSFAKVYSNLNANVSDMPVLDPKQELLKELTMVKNKKPPLRLSNFQKVLILAMFMNFVFALFFALLSQFLMVAVFCLSFLFLYVLLIIEFKKDNRAKGIKVRPVRINSMNSNSFKKGE